MVAHVITIDTQIADTGAVRYRWRCSCEAVADSWRASLPGGQGAGRAARAARNGGACHVAYQERGR